MVRRQTLMRGVRAAGLAVVLVLALGGCHRSTAKNPLDFPKPISPNTFKNF